MLPFSVGRVKRAICQVLGQQILFWLSKRILLICAMRRHVFLNMNFSWGWVEAFNHEIVDLLIEFFWVDSGLATVLQRLIVLSQFKKLLNASYIIYANKPLRNHHTFMNQMSLNLIAIPEQTSSKIHKAAQLEKLIQMIFNSSNSICYSIQVNVPWNCLSP